MSLAPEQFAVDTLNATYVSGDEYTADCVECGKERQAHGAGRGQ